MNQKSIIKAIIVGFLWGIFSSLILIISYYPRIEINSEPDTQKALLLWIVAFPAVLSAKLNSLNDIFIVLFIIINPIAIGIIFSLLVIYLKEKISS